MLFWIPAGAYFDDQVVLSYEFFVSNMVVMFLYMPLLSQQVVYGWMEVVIELCNRRGF